MSIWETLKSIFLGDEPIEVVWKDAWETYLLNNLPIYSMLPQELQLKLHDKIGQFVATTYFEGCADLELTDEMILTVAAQACILVLNQEDPPYPNLKTVLLYPTTFQSVVRERDAMGVVTEREIRRLGESWSNGTVILAWDSVQHGARNIRDGHNVTMHEFAHQLDQEDGNTDGVPLMDTHEAYRTWGSVLGDGYAQLVEKAERRKKSVLDKYGTTNLAEYFAVATEAFFEKPRQMQRKRADLYQELVDYYQLDPAEWFTKG